MREKTAAGIVKCRLSLSVSTVFRPYTCMPTLVAPADGSRSDRPPLPWHRFHSSSATSIAALPAAVPTPLGCPVSTHSQQGPLEETGPGVPVSRRAGHVSAARAARQLRRLRSADGPAQEEEKRPSEISRRTSAQISSQRERMRNTAASDTPET